MGRPWTVAALVIVELLLAGWAASRLSRLVLALDWTHPAPFWQALAPF